MIKMHEIREIIKLIDQSSIQEFNLEVEGTTVSIKKNVAATEAPVVVQAQQVPVTVPYAAPVAVTPAPVVESAAASVQPVAVEKAAPAAPAVDEANLRKIVSPMVGTFYSSPDPSSPAYVQAGDHVTPNKIVCIVEAMKLFNEIEAEVTGKIVKVLVENGQLVEYGQPLFLVQPE